MMLMSFNCHLSKYLKWLRKWQILINNQENHKLCNWH